MATKYYTATNCNRIFCSPNGDIAFEPYLYLGGVWYGLFTTDCKVEQKALSEEDGVSEMTEGEYNAELKKKATPSAEFNPLRTLSSAKAELPPLTRVEDAGPVQSVLQAADREAERAAQSKPVELNDALKVGPTDRASTTKAKRGRRKNNHAKK